MRILLIRHAEPDYSVDSLTPRGRVEAELLSRRMIRYDIRDFYVSPLGRARDTAEYTLSKLGRTAEVLPWLAEFRGRCTDPETGTLHLPWDFPPRFWSSLPGAYDIARWADASLFRDTDVSTVWQETVAGTKELLARYGFRKDGPVWLGDANSRDTIALFCHFGVEMVMLSHILQISPMPLWHGFAASPSSVTVLYSEERREGTAIFRIRQFGDLSHLYMHGEEPSFAARYAECFEDETLH